MVENLLKITRITATQTWPMRQAVMWPDQPISFVQLEEDSKGLHYGLWKADRLIAVLSLFIEKEEAQFRKFATLVSEQQKGYGSLLLKHVLEEAAQKKVKRIWCNARVAKVGFYEKFGMQVTDHTFRKKGIEYVVMEIKKAQHHC